ncbi:MAG: tetratricopeptide repeat protein [Bacteroidota bacterium]
MHSSTTKRYNKLSKWAIALFLACMCAACTKQHSRNEIPNLTVQSDTTKLIRIVAHKSDRDDDGNNYYREAKLRYHAGNPRQALTSVENAIRKSPSDPEFHLLKMQILAALNRHEQAINAFSQLRRLNYNHPQASVLAAKEYLQLGLSSKAFQSINEAIKYDPNSSDVLLVKAQTYYAIGDTSNALLAAQKVIEKKATDEEALFLTSRIHKAKGEFTESLDYLGKLHGIDTTNRDYLIESASIYQQLDQRDTVAHIYDKILELSPEDFEIHYLQGRNYLKLRKYESALAHAQQAVTFNASHVESQLLIAKAFDGNRKYDEAIEAYKYILKNDPSHKLATDELAKLERKVAYLWRLRRHQAEKSAPPPPAIVPKRPGNN